MTENKEWRRHNRRLAQWRVTWLIEHSTSHLLLWCIDSFVLRNPPLRQAPKRYQQGEGKRLQTTNLTKEMKLTTKYEIIEMTDLKAKRFSFLPTLEKRNEIHIFALNKIIKHGEVQ